MFRLRGLSRASFVLHRGVGITSLTRDIVTIVAGVWLHLRAPTRRHGTTPGFHHSGMPVFIRDTPVAQPILITRPSFSLSLMLTKTLLRLMLRPLALTAPATTMQTTWVDDTGVGDIGAATTPADAGGFEILDLQIASLRTTSPARLIGSIGSK